MIDALQVLWAPAGTNMPSLGDRALVDVTDGDTPNVRMPIRMLSVDTPEVTARSEQRAVAVDAEFARLAEWIDQGRAPISSSLAAFLLPKLATGNAGRLHRQQGMAASAFAKQNIETRLTDRTATSGTCSYGRPMHRSTTTTGSWPMSHQTTPTLSDGA